MALSISKAAFILYFPDLWDAYVLAQLLDGVERLVIRI